MRLLGSAFLLGFCLLFSCNNPQKPTGTSPIGASTPNTTGEGPLPATAQVFAKGEIVPSVAVAQSYTDSFSLYLPTTYDSAKPSPIVIFLDPHGESVKILGSYKQLADKYGYILVASKSAFNKLSALQGINAANLLVADVQQRFNLDDSRIIMAGFSGGAKIAIDAACGNSAVDAVVYTGSVLLWGTLNHDIAFLGIAGTGDMNYTELISFHESKYLKDKPHYMVTWNGKHEWPSASVFENAFLYPYTNIPANKLFTFNEADRAKFETEKQLRQAYYDALLKKDVSWWTTEAKKMHGLKKTDLMYERLLGLVSLSCYKLSQTYLNSNDLTNAQRVITVYGLVDPDNKDYARFNAELKRRLPS